MPYLVALGLRFQARTLSKISNIFFTFVVMATRAFEGIKFFQQILKRTMTGSLLWNFIRIGLVVSEKKMFRIKVNAWMDGQCTLSNDISSLVFGQ